MHDVYAKQQRPLGIRLNGNAMTTVGLMDETVPGTFWYDLATRRPVAAALKRTLDVACALLSIAVLSPLLLAFAPFIRRERRIGFRGTEFTMYTFRRGPRALPQLFNVLEGTMSLVGPRPLRRSAGAHSRRFSVRPGLLGMGELTDRQYVADWSLGLDLRIAARALTRQNP